MGSDKPAMLTSKRLPAFAVAVGVDEDEVACQKVIVVLTRQLL